MQTPQATPVGTTIPATVGDDFGGVIDRSHALVSSARVEGTTVLNRQGDRLGTIHSIMIHKTTGQAAYALLAFGGFFGLGQHVHPIPWAMLEYRDNGYVVDITREQLETAPTLNLDAAARPRETEQRMYDHWNVMPYW
ncbi:PRC-barrel domain-containing protein [Sphingomonas solaris]|uniref:PRC-barrel domain containing protein n=1 Tax=Alterirhizorhabdus solaris TaxID=2529389 RepID=A0A558QZE0_9SPHN|nr:PRC-barrel domain-containing protein [Sphingomonas solaris]TVV72526.1 PRC-barrel domain containing protein [Sphingomonas solaris]